jgi:NTP pyrophosphatase (non-canonical NTP hydrolase)
MTFAEAVAAFKARLTPESEWLGEIAARAVAGDREDLFVIDVGDWQDDLAISAHVVHGRQLAIVYPSSLYAVTDAGPYQVKIAPVVGSHTLDLRDLTYNRLTWPEVLRTGRTTRNAALTAVLAELDRAQTKFPTWPTDPLHAASILAEEVGELQRAILQFVYEPDKAQPGDVQTEAVQTAAMALRFLLSLDRYVYARSEQHTQEKA